MAQGLLGVLLGHDQRDLHRLALEPGSSGPGWSGRPECPRGAGGRPAHCFCVRTIGELPPSTA